MGQQQLLLLVLGTVIVGLAVVVGIDAFSEGQLKSNADAMVNDAVRIASDAQAWKMKPAAYGGGADTDWTSLTWDKIGYEATSGTYSNLNGDYTLATTASKLTISGAGNNNNNTVTVEVTGSSADSISTSVTVAP